MADAPERIRVAQDADGFWTCREAVSGSQEYVRADLYAALEAQLAGARVKPLEWVDADEGMCTKWRAAALGGHYELVAFEGEDGFAVNFSWGRPLSFWFIQGEPDEWGPTGPKVFPSLDEAKAAAQADYERRILSALTLSPAGVTEEEVEAAAREISPHLWVELTHEQRMSDDYAFTSRRDAQERARKQARAALEAAAKALSPAPVATIEQVLDAFDAETKTVPLGHENRQRGASTYNWRRAIADEIRSLAAAMIAAAPAPPKAGD